MTKYVTSDVVQRVEHRIARRWVRGLGRDAEFDDDSLGWWVVFQSCASMYLGREKPGLVAGDRVRVTVEKMP